MYINWDFSCQCCGHKEDFLVDNKEEFPTQDCPACEGKGTMLRVYSAVTMNTSDSLSFCHIPEERKHALKAERLRTKAKNSKNKKVREESAAIFTEMNKHKD